MQFHGGYGELTADDVNFTFDGCSIPKSRSIASRCTPAPSRASPPTVRAPSCSSSSGPIRYSAAASSIPAVAASSPARPSTERGDKHAMNSIGTGGYQLDRIDPAKGVFLKAFAEHWEGAPAIPELRFTYILDTTARTLALLAGQVDMIEGSAGAGLDPVDPGPQEGPAVRHDGAGQHQHAAHEHDAQAVRRHPCPPGAALRDRQGGAGQEPRPHGPADGRIDGARLCRRGDRGRPAPRAALQARSRSRQEAAGRGRVRQRACRSPTI